MRRATSTALASDESAIRATKEQQKETNLMMSNTHLSRYRRPEDRTTADITNMGVKYNTCGKGANRRCESSLAVYRRLGTRQVRCWVRGGAAKEAGCGAGRD